MERFKSYCRLCGDNNFRQIAEIHLDRFEEITPKVKTIREEMSSLLSSIDNPETPPSEYYSLLMVLDPLEEERYQACIISVVFTAMYFEAFIYDYAATCFGDKYSKEHLDKLDFISKWLIIPKLAIGKELSKSGQAYEALKRLHKDRNSLVHLKSKELNFTHDELANYLMASEKDIQDSALNCRKALEHVIRELEVIDPEHPRVLAASKSKYFDESS